MAMREVKRAERAEKERLRQAKVEEAL